MDKEVHILFVEDVVTDLELIKRALLKNEIRFLEQVVETKTDFIDSIQTFSPDIILSDYSLPQFNGMEALDIRKKLAPMVPFILITGSNNEEIAVECMKAGADDYILKDNLTRLGHAVLAALSKYEFIRSKKIAEDALHESEELFRTAFENAAIGVCMIDTKGFLINANKTLCFMSGYEKEALLNRNFRDILYADDLEQSASIFNMLSSGKAENLSFEIRCVHKYGHLIWVHLFITHIHGIRDQSNYYVAYLLDITERKKAEQVLLNEKLRVEESDRLKTIFLQNISHEIRTPLNAIMGFSSFLKDKELPFEKISRFAGIIIDSSNQLLSIISDIITISTIEAGQQKVIASEINLNEIMTLIYNQFQQDAVSRGIELHYKAPGENLEKIITDESKLVSVLTNLVGNALKFTIKGSVLFGYDIKDQVVEFFIKDTGIGIPENMFGEIFTRFHQLDMSENRQFGGSGLGLSISKSYVELLGGRIWLTSEMGKGSVFCFTIPHRLADLKKPTDEFTKDVRDVKPLNILIAEDEYSNSYLLEVMLSDQNCNIIRAQNGQEAVDICKISKDIDVILMDIKMPKMNGLEAIRQIRAFYPSLPIIALSAYSSPEEQKKSLIAGCDLFLTKPIDKVKLMDVLAQIRRDSMPSVTKRS